MRVAGTSRFWQRDHQEKLTFVQRAVGDPAATPSPSLACRAGAMHGTAKTDAMTHKKPRHQSNPAETLRDLADTKQQQAQRAPPWPNAKEHAQPQHAHARPAD